MKTFYDINTNQFKEIFNHEPEYQVECGGRFEILGNHTDHNHGRCCAATCDLTIYGFVSKRNDNIVKMNSIGFDPFEINLDELDIKKEEINSSQGLIRGVAAYLKDNGYKYGGFEIYSKSAIFPGAGVSSSAAFELLIGQIYNVLFNEGKIEKIVLAKAGQYSENNYFGKKSGLLDQIGTGFGNIVYIDFKNIASPIVENIEFPFKDLHFVICNTGGSHAELSDLYSAIPMDMWSAAKKMGHEFLREGSIEELKATKCLTEMELNRGTHFYGEDARVGEMMTALKNKDRQLFLDLMNGSRKSSTEYLKNMMVGNDYAGSPLEATDIAMKLMNNEGACKINGGGFAGSIICVVPEKYLTNFIKGMGDKYGAHNVKEVQVRTAGPEVIKL